MLLLSFLVVIVCGMGVACVLLVFLPAQHWLGRLCACVHVCVCMSITHLPFDGVTMELTNVIDQPNY